MKEMFQIRDGCLTVLLPKELDHPHAERIREETDCLMGREYVKKIIFDFKNTTFMDSSGIGVIMGRYRALGLRSGSIAAVHVSERIRRILRLSGIHRFIDISREKSPEQNNPLGGEHDGEYE